MTEFYRKETAIEEERKMPNSFIMVKNHRGGLSVMLEPYDFSAPARKIRFKYNQDVNHVPTKWALGVFITQESLSMMERGYFFFENLELLIQMAEDAGLYVPDSIKEPKVTLKELKILVLNNDIKSIEQKMFNANKNLIGDLVEIARKNIDRINVATVNFIEKKYNVTLKPINLNE